MDHFENIEGSSSESLHDSGVCLHASLFCLSDMNETRSMMLADSLPHFLFSVCSAGYHSLCTCRANIKLKNSIQFLTTKVSLLVQLKLTTQSDMCFKGCLQFEFHP